MGRIAEALKRAEGERAEKLRLRGAAGAEEASCAVTAIPAARSSRGTRGGERTILTHDSITDTTGASVVSGDSGTITDRTAAPRESETNPTTRPSPGNRDERLVCLTDPAGVISEQYRAVRTWLLRHNTTGEHRSIAVTSSVTGEGKSLTTANLGVALAEVKHLNVLMIDADLRRGRLAGLIGATDSPGLADVLTGRATLNESVHRTGVRNLSILPAGRLQEGSPAEWLSSRTAQVVFDEVRERFHYVLVDTPAVQTASDVGIIGGMCGGILMVVRLHATPEQVARQSLRWLTANNLHVLGCVATAAQGGRGGRTSLDGAARHDDRAMN